MWVSTNQCREPCLVITCLRDKAESTRSRSDDVSSCGVSLCQIVYGKSAKKTTMADEPGALNWRLSAHPITLLCYLGFRIGMPTLNVDLVNN